MAIVNFSVPDEVKKAFNDIFAGQNKSAIIADLMRKAVEEAERQQHRAEAIKTLTERRAQRTANTEEALIEARGKGRP